jgi:hypothetical protein
MKCVGACGLVAQCDECQLGDNEKVVLTCVLSIYIPSGNLLFSPVALHSWYVGVYMFSRAALCFCRVMSCSIVPVSVSRIL